MANPTGFIQFDRVEIAHRAIEERVRDFSEIDLPFADDELNRQAAGAWTVGSRSVTAPAARW